MCIGLPVGQKLKAPALLALVNEDPDLLALSDDKLKQAIKEVEEKRLLLRRGIRPSNVAAGKDYMVAVSAFEREVR